MVKDELPKDGVMVATCGCQMTTTSFNVHEAQFSGLDSEELYFPLVAAVRDMAIYGLAPDAVAPEPRSSGHGLAIVNIPFHAKPDDIMYSDEDEDPGTTSIRQYGPWRLCSQVVPSIGSTGYSTPTGDGETMSCLPVCTQRMKELAKERELEHGKRIEWNDWVADNLVVQFEKLVFPRRSQVSSVVMLYYCSSCFTDFPSPSCLVQVLSLIGSIPASVSITLLYGTNTRNSH